MARQVRRISELPEATGLTGDELIEIVQGGDNFRLPVNQLPGSAVQSVQGRTGNVVITAGDVGLGNVDNTSDADKPVSTAQHAALDAKVDAVAGMGLSSNDFTDPLREKLIGLEGAHWRGTFVSLAALQAGVTDPEAGDYADVDTVGADVERYIWDATDSIWVVQSGAVAPITASQVKLLYESNPDTNSFTDAEKSKLGGIAAGATVNSTDAHLLSRANHTGEQAISTVTGLQGELDGRVLNNDSRLTNSREWTAETVSQAEAETGTAITRRAWTAQRVRQAIVAWWNGVSSAWGRGFVSSADAAAGRTALGLGSAATATVQSSPTDTTAGALMAVGAFGLGSRHVVTDANLAPTGLSILNLGTALNVPGGLSGVGWLETDAELSFTGSKVQRLQTTDTGRLFTRTIGVTGWQDTFHTGNILGTVSQSAGVPTGAIIERGSNANGEYVRFADGTQECWMMLTPTTVPANDFVLTTVTYPASFAAPPKMVVSPSTNFSTGIGSAIGFSDNGIAHTNAASRIVRFNTTLGSLGVGCNVRAIGSWY